MLNSFRRGQVSLSKSIRLFAFQPLRNSSSPKLFQSCSVSQNLLAVPHVRALHATSRWRNIPAVAVQEHIEAEDSSLQGTGSEPFVTEFADLAKQNLVCDTLVRALTQDMKLQTMTPVQSQTINVTLRGSDTYVV